MSFIKCENVCKEFMLKDDKFQIIKNLSFEIESGDFCAILGESGSGKSTLLNILSGIDFATSGKVIIDGIDITTLSQDKMSIFRRDRLGFVFQSYNLINHLTALENVEYPLVFCGVPKKERLIRAKEMLKKVGLEDRMNHKPSELSGGQQQRVSIARALINNPKLILADEPTGNLDSKTSVEILELLKKINEEEKTTLVVVTHSLNTCDYVNKILKMKDGQLEIDREEDNNGNKK